MNLREFIQQEVVNLIKESRFGRRRSFTLHAEIDAYSSISEKAYKIEADMEVEPSEPSTYEYPGSQGATETTINKAISEDGEVFIGENEIKNLFTDQDWMEINKDLEIEFEKQVDDYDNEPDPDDIRDMRMGLEEYIKNEVINFHQKMLLESQKEQIENELRILKEGGEFGDEGPQPGDVEYHYTKKGTPFTGIGPFDNIDWKAIHEILVHNTKITKEKAPGFLGQMELNVGDFTDSEDGYLSLEELNYLAHHDLIYILDGVPIIDDEQYLDFDTFYNKAKKIWMLETLTESELKLASGNPLDGKSKQSAINAIYKIFKQIDHGQRYRDTAWENVHKIFNTFGKYGMDTTGGYDAKYNPGGINVDSATPQWKKWNIDFNFKDNKGTDRILTFILTAHAGGTTQDPWNSYDITFYPIAYKRASMGGDISEE